MHSRMLDAFSRLLTEIIALFRLRWLGDVLLMRTNRQLLHALFAHAEQGWKKRSGDQALTWRRDMMKLASSLSLVVTSCFPGYGPRDEVYCCLETLRGIAQNRSQWLECCMACLLNSAPLKKPRQKTE